MSISHWQRCKSILLGSLLALGALYSATTAAKTVTDIVGREVNVPDHVERILLGEGRLIHAITLLEGDKPFARIAGWQGDFRKLDAQNYAAYQAKFPQIDNIPLIGNTTAESISNEKVLTLKPDIAIFGLSGHGPGRSSALVNLLTKLNIPVIFVDFRSYPMKNTLPSIKLLGEALGREQQAQRYIDFYQQQLKRVTDVVQQIPQDQRRSVFIELKAAMNGDSYSTAGNGNMGEFVDVAGGINIAKPLLPTALGQVNLEKVIALNPDIYIATGGRDANDKLAGVKLGAGVTEQQALASAKEVLSRKGISMLSAVQQGRSHALWHGFYNSPYNIVAIQKIAKWLYPTQFADLDPKQTMQQLYGQFLSIPVSGTFWVDNYHQ